MIIKGLKNIQKHMESAYQNNLEAWYEHNLPKNARPRGMRRDLYIASRVRQAELARIAQQEQELRWQRAEAQKLYHNHQMHLAMGCDDRSCTTC